MNKLTITEKIFVPKKCSDELPEVGREYICFYKHHHTGEDSFRGDDMPF